MDSLRSTLSSLPDKVIAGASLDKLADAAECVPLLILGVEVVQQMQALSFCGMSSLPDKVIAGASLDKLADAAEYALCQCTATETQQWQHLTLPDAPFISLLLLQQQCHSGVVAA